MRHAALSILIVAVACGGSSRHLESSDPGSGGTTASGSGGTTASGTGGGAATGGSLAGSGGGGATLSVGGAVSGTSGVGGKGGPSVTGGSAGRGGSSAEAGAPDSMGATGGSRAGTGGSIGEAGMAGTAGMPLPTVTPITSCNDEFPFSGRWVGSVLDFYFEAQESLTLVINADGKAGTLTWGEGDPPPAPEGADIPYPPGYWDNVGMEGDPLRADPWPGFAYTIVRGAGCDSTLRLAVSTSELFSDWCALQTPKFTPEIGWGCTLQGGGSSDGVTCNVQPQGVTPESYPMWKCSACGAFWPGGGVCACDESACTGNLTPTHTFDLTLIQSGGKDVLTGADPTCGDCTVRLERQD